MKDILLKKTHALTEESTMCLFNKTLKCRYSGSTAPSGLPVESQDELQGT